MDDPDQFTLSLAAGFCENFSPAAERQSFGDYQLYSKFQTNQRCMKDIKKTAKSLGLVARLESEQHQRRSRSTQHYGGGPVVDHRTMLDIIGLITAGAEFIKAARPVMIEYLKTRTGAFKFKHGDLTIDAQGEDGLDKIEAHLETLIKLAESTDDKSAKLTHSPKKASKVPEKKRSRRQLPS